MGITENVSTRAALLGGVAAWLTYISAGEEWLIKDYLFVLAIVIVVLIGGSRKAKYERLIHQARLERAHDLEKVDFIQGDPVQLALNKVTCILFFGTWCKKSREALMVFAYLHETIVHDAVQFVGLTQESREELAMYEVKGRNASNFRELKKFAFSIGIEDGSMSKEYLVRCDIFTVPQLFIVGKNKSIEWYGDPTIAGIASKIRSAIEQDDVKSGDTGVSDLKTTNMEEKKQSNAA
ncbi:hypothetical protein BBJ29_004360 [Phytophthora kernoviae]|uniref:Uncharacterized protein n=1 Tax=Phytophthora kernoviae TaxID=325452 RepID=A0A3F2S0N9_9STRA|nr:hypothetical protein BBJ29_004360 [Phytophthora kernoviae]RLN67992.1 hypothetical protein BBP00_00001238 [Phytophthora kernoviae]